MACETGVFYLLILKVPEPLVDRNWLQANLFGYGLDPGEARRDAIDLSIESLQRFDLLFGLLFECPAFHRFRFRRR